MNQKHLIRTKKALLSWLLAGISVSSLAVDLSSTSTSEWSILSRFKLPGSGTWDYLKYDPVQRNLYIARSNRIQIIDPKNGVLLSEIDGTPGVHGVAIATGADKAYSSNGNDQSITVFQPSTLKILTKIKTPQGIKPDFIAYDDITQSVLAFNGKSNNVTVITVSSDQVAKTISLSGKPEAAVTNDQGQVFVNIENKNALQRIDLHKSKVTATWKLPACDEPAGLAMDVKTNRLFVGCHNKVLLMVNAKNGHVVSQASIGEDVDTISFDPSTQLVFSSNADGTLTVLHEDNDHRLSIRQTLTTPSHSKTMAFNTHDHLAYLVSAEFEAPNKPGGKSLPKPDSFEVLVIGTHAPNPETKP
jgi:DNA-binding beta-propeller fold protein YncE